MVDRESLKKRRRILSCIVLFSCAFLFCLAGCDATYKGVKRTADDVLKADQWFRDKYW